MSASVFGICLWDCTVAVVSQRLKGIIKLPSRNVSVAHELLARAGNCAGFQTCLRMNEANTKVAAETRTTAGPLAPIP
jgi:hypothetical protein